jgi:hypothetical protein
MSDTIIPREIDKFNTYIINTNARQLATNAVTGNPYWTDYGWVVAQSNAYKTNWHDQWVNTVYPKYIDPQTSTGIVKQDTHDFIAGFVGFMDTEKLLEKIKASTIVSETDATIWNFVLERAAPSGPPAKIMTEIFADITGRGHGVFDIHVRAASDASRPSIPRDAGADSVQFSYGISETAAAAITDPNSKLLQRSISPKAHFEFEAGSENQGKWLVIYFRWYNTSYPAIAGDWSTMAVVSIG